MTMVLWRMILEDMMGDGICLTAGATRSNPLDADGTNADVEDTSSEKAKIVAFENCIILLVA